MKNLDEVNRAYFLGAGSSVPDGVPITAGLTGAIAADLKSAMKKGVLEDNTIYQYLKTIYDVSENDIRSLSNSWYGYVERGQGPIELPRSFPDIIEILTILDLAISDGLSFGPAAPRPGRELAGNHLREIRETIGRALASRFFDVKVFAAEGDIKKTLSYQFIRKTGPSDVFLTTNWDPLLDLAITSSDTSAFVKYGTHPVHHVDGSGTEVLHKSGMALDGAYRELLKLHGSLNWLCCPRCQTLYVNVVYMIAHIRPGSAGNTCRCGAQLSSLIIAPSFIKGYRSLHLSAIWRRALMVLARAQEWVFIGYSLPPDDFAIRALLLQALTIKRGPPRRDSAPKVTVVTRGTRSSEIKERYEQMFGVGKPEIRPSGFEGYIADLS